MVDLTQELDILTEEDTKGLAAIWLADEKTPEDKESMRKVLRGSRPQFDALQSILRRLYRQAHVQSEDMTAPNWETRVAFAMGYKKALRDLAKIVPKTDP